MKRKPSFKRGTIQILVSLIFIIPPYFFLGKICPSGPEAIGCLFTKGISVVGIINLIGFILIILGVMNFIFYFIERRKTIHD